MGQVLHFWRDLFTASSVLGEFLLTDSFYFCFFFNHTSLFQINKNILTPDETVQVNVMINFLIVI